MKVIYGNNNYKFENIDSEFILNLKECSEDEEVVLSRFEESFKLLYYGLDSICLKTKTKECIEELYTGLKYFQTSEDFLYKFKGKASENIFLIKEAQDMIEKYFENSLDFNFKKIGSNPNFSPDFFKKCIDNGKHISFADLCSNPDLKEDFFEDLIQQKRKLNWTLLILNSNLSKEFFQKYKHLILWDFLYTCVIPSFLYRQVITYQKSINITSLFLEEDLPIVFFRKYINEIRFFIPVENREFVESFFEKILENKREKILPFVLCDNEGLSVNFFRKMIKKEYRPYWNFLCGNKNLPLDFFQENEENINYEFLCANKNIPSWFFENAMKEGYKLYWEWLCGNENVFLDFIMNFLKNQHNSILKYSCYQRLCINNKVSFELFQKIIKDEKEIAFPINSLIYNKNIPLSFFEKNKLYPENNIIKATIIYDILN